MNSPHTLSRLGIQMRSGWHLLAYISIFIVAVFVTCYADSQLLQKAGAWVWIFCLGFFSALTLPIWSRNAAEDPKSLELVSDAPVKPSTTAE